MPYLRCDLCYRARRAGDKSIRTVTFARLTDHLKRAHQLDAAEARKRTAIERNKKCISQGGRRLWYCPCGAIVVKKGQHLTTSKKAHPELKVSVMMIAI